MMRKIKYLFVLVMSVYFYGQDGEMGFSKPVASVSSLSSYTNTPISYATGMPEINLPITSLSSNSKEIGLGFSLSYHPKNLLSTEKASEVGLGWTLMGSIGVISREIIGGIDEKFNDENSENYVKNEFDDIYYYNIGSYQGKFRVIRDLINNTFQIIKLTPSNLKIEYTRENNNATLIFNTFKITDEKGYIYYFDKYSISEFKQGTYRTSYKSAFYISKIYDYKNVELINFEYIYDFYTSPGVPTLNLQTCKIKKITSLDNGSMEWEYLFDANYRKSLNDPFQVSTIILKNNVGTLVNKYEFIYGFSSFTDPTNYALTLSKRVLTKLKKYNCSLDKFESTDFEYNQDGSNTDYSPIANQYKDYFLFNYCYSNPDKNEIENPKYFVLGSLNKIKLPTGGYVKYNFESNQYYKNKDNTYISSLGTSEFIDPEVQYLNLVKSGNFDTNSSRNIQFNVTGASNVNKLIYVYFRVDEKYLFDPMLDPGGLIPEVGYSIQNASFDDSSIVCVNTDSDASVSKYVLGGGAKIINIQNVGCTGGNGYYEIYELTLKNVPYKNAVSKKGIRIKSIEYFDALNSLAPSKTESFVYEKFDDGNTTSGELFGDGNVGEDPSEYVIYKNVKVLNGNTGGYTKYFYKTPSDFPAYSNGDFYQYWPYTNITKNGLLDKKEIYDASNSLIASEVYNYTFQEINMPQYAFYPVTDGAAYYTKTAWIKEYRNTSKVKTQNNQEIIVSSETIKESANFNIISEKVTNSDGSIKETFYKYPLDKNNTALINANILGIPLETEIKNNGVTVGKSEVRYDNATNLFPTSILNYNLDDFNQSYKSVIYDIYDSKGNLVQYSTTPDASTNIGMPTTIIWGYNKTLPIAKIEGAKLSDIPQALIDAIVNASNDDANATPSTAQTTENALLVQLESFKNNASLANFLVTAYTYDPLVGVTNVLPVNGIREIYKYDSFNRLEKVYDVNGKILKEYQYNYKQ